MCSVDGGRYSSVFTEMNCRIFMRHSIQFATTHTLGGCTFSNVYTYFSIQSPRDYKIRWSLVLAKSSVLRWRIYSQFSALICCFVVYLKQWHPLGPTSTVNIRVVQRQTHKTILS